MLKPEPRYVVKVGFKRVDILDTHTQECAVSYFGSHWSKHLDQAKIHAEKACDSLNRQEAK
jgi:hypothetical protein